MTLRFTHFWRGFNPQKNLFVDIMQKDLGVDSIRVVRDPRVRVDLEVQSVFMQRRQAVRGKIERLINRGPRSGDPALAHVLSDQLPSPNARHSLWFTGENVRPPAGAWDSYLSYDLDSFDGRNYYFPLWMTLLDWHGDAFGVRLGSAVRRKDLVAPRAQRARRARFCCTFVGNNHPMRSHAIEALGRVGQVDVFGPAVGRPVASKLEVAQEYDFLLCFENDDYPGYVTEKPVESWMTGAVPIWWGNDASASLNSNALVNLKNCDGLVEMVDRVAEIYADSQRYFDVHRQPLMLRLPTLEAAISAFRRVVE
jgi:hypothetical protein